MTQLLLRVHFTLLRLKATAWLYGSLLSTLTACRKHLDFLRFRWLRSRPDLNGSSISRWIGEEASSARSDERLDLRMLVHVTFHFDKSRFSYLSEVLRNISNYNLKACRIVVNTNSEKTVDMLRRFNIPGDVVVRKELHHPFMLTWACRADMARQLEEFDLFMYVEDDILVPFSAVKRWHKETIRLRGTGFLPGFLRVELDRKNSLVASDYFRPASSEDVVEINLQKYLSPPFPYQAFWLYDRGTMEEFISRDCYWPRPKNSENFNDVRERAAFGLTYETPPDGYLSRHLLPLGDDGNVSSDMFVFHLPSNYGRRLSNSEGSLGTLKVAGLIKY